MLTLVINVVSHLVNKSFKKLKLGLIGGGSQFNRISQVLKGFDLNFFKYKPAGPQYYDKFEFKKLRECDAIFILSPNHTHMEYIEKLHTESYIFCEKPPVSSIEQLEKLKNLPHEKIYFNFNWRFSTLAEILRSRESYDLGELIYGNIITGHGLALKEEYSRSWRANRNFCNKGVFEIVSVHWVDLINHIFDIKEICTPSLLNLSGKGDSFDNSYTKIILDNNKEIDIFSSYTSAYLDRKIFAFSNGYVEQVSNAIEIRGPAMNLDKDGFFKNPELIRKVDVNEDEDYNLSIKTSVINFLEMVLQGAPFPLRDFNCSIRSNELILT